MVTKQMASLGVPVWDDSWTKDASDNFEPETCNEIRLYCYCADGGPDQKKCKDIVSTELEWCPWILFLVMNCCQHSAALITEGNLRIMDNWAKRMKLLSIDPGYGGYFAAVAKLVHVWRDGVQQVWKISTAMFGNLVAQTFFKKLPPKCIAGRWGSLSGSETFLLAPGKRKVKAVIEAVCGVLQVQGIDRRLPDGGGDLPNRRNTASNIVLSVYNQTNKIPWTSLASSPSLDIFSDLRPVGCSRWTRTQGRRGRYG
jgi:hypothetical protein